VVGAFYFFNDKEYGTKILVTVLFSRTIPLIRYEMSDSIKVENIKCSCGLPYRIIGGIQGRKEETLYLPDKYGNLVKLEPNLFHKIMEIIPVAGWQIIQDIQNSIRILVVEPSSEYSEYLLIEKLQTELGYENVHPEIQVEYVNKLQQTETGKIILIKSLVN
jgi:phenylacetate-coenzyme A ligase PaaK-like adenylate-forming protein